MSTTEQKRDRYQTDEEYRESVKKYQRDRYRDENPDNIRDCSSSLRKISSFGQKRRVIGEDGKIKNLITLSTDEIAQAMDYHPINVRQWQGSGKFPKPLLKIEGSKLHVYSLTQAKGLVATIAKHQIDSQYLRSSDGNIIKMLHRFMMN